MEHRSTLHPPDQDTPSFSVFGQTWYFTEPAVKTLAHYGMETKKDLKALIVESASLFGITEGTHEINFLGVNLSLIVKGDRVLVIDPFV